MDAQAFFIIDGHQYRFRGWLGCQLASVERKRLPIGQVRHILDRYFHVFSVKRLGFGRHETTWALVLPKDIDAANAVVRALKDDMRALV